MTRHKKKRRQTGTQPQRLDVRMEEMAAALARTRALLSAEDHALFTNMVDTLAWIQAELQTKDASIDRLRNMIFGASSEKTRDVLGDDTEDTDAAPRAEVPGAEAPAAPRPKAPGHGKNGAVAYTGATQVTVAHPHLHSGEVYTAPSPADVGEEKYDATATSMLGLFKYGVGVSFNRIEKLQDGLKIPLPAATQWDLVQAAAKTLAPAHEEMSPGRVSPMKWSPTRT